MIQPCWPILVFLMNSRNMHSQQQKNQWQPGLSSACSPPGTLQRRNYITNGAIQESHELRSHVCRVAFWGHCKFFKMSLSAVHKMYIVAAILRKALTCMYGNSTSEYFTLNPPTIHNYFA